MRKTIAQVSLGMCFGIGFGMSGVLSGPSRAEEMQIQPPLQASVKISQAVKNHTPEENVPTVDQDPLHSPHPVPWNWVLETQSSMQAQKLTGVRYYRSPSLLSPDGIYAAYSRIQLHVETNSYENRADSVLFIENTKTGSLGVVVAKSPFAQALGTGTPNASPASVSLLIPVSWSADSEQLLAREFDAILNTDDLTDYGIVWDRTQNQTQVVAPQGIFYHSAVLLGWSRRNPDQVLFKAGEFGETLWSLWNVGLEGKTAIAVGDEPLILGEQLLNPWAGPQAYWPSSKP